MTTSLPAQQGVLLPWKDVAMTGGQPEATNRLGWDELPPPLREAIRERAGAEVVQVRSSRTGFSAGFAGVLELVDGRRLFVKAGDGATNAETASLHRREAHASRWIPPGLAPRLLWSFASGAWVVLALEAIDGRHPGNPWSDEDLERALRAQADLSRVAAPPDAAPVAPVVAEMMTGWQSMRTTEDARGLPEWLRPRVDEMAAWEGERTRAAAEGRSVVHLDLRSDNMLIDAAGRVHLVDWPHAGAGAPWLDVAFLAPTVPVEGGPPAAEVFRRSPLAAAAPPEDVRVVVAGWAGRLLWASRQPDPPGIPTLRAFQAAQARTTLEWLRELLDGRPVTG
jgi:hypothetical protein